MRSRAIFLIFAVVFFYGSSELLAQNESAPSTPTSPQEKTEPAASQDQPAQVPPPNTPPPSSGPAAEPTPPLATPASPEKATPPPKPPLLHHAKRKSTKKKSPSAHRTTTDEQQTQPSKVVVRNGGAKEGAAQIAPGTSPAQAQYQRATAAELMATTDANLKRVAGRQLTPAEQSTLDEIHSYLRQAKAASDAGDTSRAQTLAYKARLLSDELARK